MYDAKETYFPRFSFSLTHTQASGEALQWLLQICHHSNIAFNLAETDRASCELNTLCAVFDTSEQVRQSHGQKVGGPFPPTPTPTPAAPDLALVEGAQANISPSIDDRL